MTSWQYVLLAGLGALHGLNPGMGWLAALATGVRAGSRNASLKALVPIAGGHALAVFVAAFGMAVLRSVIATQVVAVIGGAGLVAFGLCKALARGDSGVPLAPTHLAGWSFLMSCLHGAGLALLPVIVAMPLPPPAHPHGPLGTDAVLSTSLWTGASATAVHTVGMVAVAGAIALIAFEVTRVPKLRAWRHLDRVWACALIGSGILTATVSLTT